MTTTGSTASLSKYTNKQSSHPNTFVALAYIYTCFLKGICSYKKNSHHPINWKDTSVIDRSRRPEELLLPSTSRASLLGNASTETGGRGFPSVGCIEGSEGAVDRHPNRNFQRQSMASGDTQWWFVCGYKLKALALTSAFALKKTRASGRNIGKVPILLLQAGNTRTIDFKVSSQILLM